MGTSSLATIPTVLHESGHCNWHYVFQSWLTAPQPKEPDTSEYTWVVGAVGGKKDRPFQCFNRHCHHAMSARTSTLRRIKCEGFDTLDIRENSERRKMHPGLITVVACERCPVRDSKSLHVHALRVLHCPSRTCSRWTLSAGRLSWKCMVSIWIPKKDSMALVLVAESLSGGSKMRKSLR